MTPTNKKTTLWSLITLSLALASVVTGASVPVRKTSPPSHLIVIQPQQPSLSNVTKIPQNQQDTSPQLLEHSLASDFNASNPIETTMHKGGGGGGGGGHGGGGGGHGSGGGGKGGGGSPAIIAGGGHRKSGAGRIAVGEPLVLVLGVGMVAFAAAGAF